MTILAIDIALATCGWSVVEVPTGKVLDLGVVITEPSATLGVQADRVARMQIQAAKLDRVLESHGCSAVVVESLSFAKRGGINAAASVCLSMGVAIGLAAAHAIALYTVQPKQWQHAVLGRKGKVDYDQVETELHAYVEGMGGAALESLLTIPKGQRNHPLDSVAVGVYAARHYRHLAMGTNGVCA